MGIGKQIHAGHPGPDGADGLKGDLHLLKGRLMGLGLPPSGNVGSPVPLPNSLDTKYRVGNDKQSQVIAWTLEELLAIKDRPELFERGEDPPSHIRIADSQNPPSLSAEDRFDDAISPEAFPSLHGLIATLATDGPRDR